jgi:glycosyltransferase involved in cell wall biosynthesis
MIDSLSLARALGYKVVWTMHNLYPHDSGARELDHLMRLAITSCASAVIVHCEHARALVSSHFHREDGVFVIPHGHFCDAYPNIISRAEARRSFGLTDQDFVYLFFGNVRSNKGVEHLLETFLAMEGADRRFLFAARICSDYSARVVERARHADPRIILRESDFYRNDEFQWFFNAADVAVFPFTDILTSGSAVTALSFYCPVIVPAIGCLPQQVDAAVGVVYDPAVPDALQRALEQASSLRRDALRPAMEQRLRDISWEKIASKTLEAYCY